MICHLGTFNSTVYWPFNAYAAQPVWCHHWVGHCGFLQEVRAGCCTHAITEFEISQRWTETLPEYQLFLIHFRSGVEYICIQWFPIFISVFFSNYTMPVTEFATKATLHVVYIHPVGTIESQQGTSGEVDGDLMGTTNISPDPTSTLYMNQC